MRSPELQTPISPELRKDEVALGERINEMFNGVARRYDLLNSVMTAGMHRRWTARAADAARLRSDSVALDVCCGTGDLTLALANTAPGAKVIGCDFSEPMMELARSKATDRDVETVRFEWADAMGLPYENELFDAVCVGYGVRNFANRTRGLEELVRVLRPSGRLVVLEFTPPRRFPFRDFYALWFERIVPLLGRLSSSPKAYSYLPESVRTFPGPKDLAGELAAAGVGEIRYTILAGGIVTIHSGVKPKPAARSTRGV